MMDIEKLINLICDKIQDDSCIRYCNHPPCNQCKIVANYLVENGVIMTPETGIGDLSDGYHTFNELYHHRAILFSVVCNIFKDKAWKSKRHADGDMYDGMFIVGIETPEGQATYHYDIKPYWDMFQVQELPNAPEWDGHTPEEAIRRISTLKPDIILPPCKVGDIVYYITGIGHNLIKPAKIKEIIIGEDGIKDLYVQGDGHNFENSFDTFFLTREEAEKTLEKG